MCSIIIHLFVCIVFVFVCCKEREENKMNVNTLENDRIQGKGRKKIELAYLSRHMNVPRHNSHFTSSWFDNSRTIGSDQSCFVLAQQMFLYFHHILKICRYQTRIKYFQGLYNLAYSGTVNDT